MVHAGNEAVPDELTGYTRFLSRLTRLFNVDWHFTGPKIFSKPWDSIWPDPLLNVSTAVFSAQNFKFSLEKSFLSSVVINVVSHYLFRSYTCNKFQ